MTIGFYLSDHPLSTYEGILDKMRVLPSSRLETKLGSQYAAVKMAGIVLSRKIKTSPKGRFAFIGLSDAAGSYEVSVFDETLLSSKFDLLETGTLLLITADGKRDDGGVRLIAQGIETLDVASQKHAGGNITVEIESAQICESLKVALGEEVQKGCVVELRVPIAKGIAKLKLQGKYNVSPAQFSELESIQGVRKARQA